MATTKLGEQAGGLNADDSAAELAIRMLLGGCAER